MKYQVGSIIQYKAFGGELRTVIVESKEADIKNGRPGFDGELVDASNETVWGYDDQIVQIVKF